MRTDVRPGSTIPFGLLALVLGILAGCATPRVQTIDAIVTSPALHPDHILADDGMRLPLTVWQPAGVPRAVVLALHGFNDYRRSFEETGELLAARGVAVYAYDQRGFGETDGAGGWFGEQRLSADVHMAARLIRARHPGLPIYLLGESMGGAVALSALAAYPTGWADGLILLAPAVWGRETMPWLQRAGLWLIAHTFPATRLSARGLNIRATDNDAALRKLREDPLVIKETRVEALWGLSDLMDHALSTPPPAALPTLILYGERDQIIPKRPTCRWLAARPASPLHRLAVYPEGWHMLTRDLQAGRVLEDIASWLDDPARPLPSGAEVSTQLPAFCLPPRGG
ncbi:MAG: lysophospholipase [Thiobacillaceae bacterium]